MPTTDKRPLKVFLCHAHADRDRVRALYTRLTKDGVDAWLDKEKLLPGQDWELEIKKAVREADVVVVCLSKQFNQAGFRQKEVAWALETAMEQPKGEIFLIPARLDKCDVPDQFLPWHWVNLFDLNGYEWLMRSLKKRADSVSANFISYEKIERNELLVHPLAARASEFSVCLVGPPGSGKTMYLSMLPFANTDGWKILPYTETTRYYHLENMRSRERLLFLPATTPGNDVTLTYDIVPRREFFQKHKLLITVDESAGGNYMRTDNLRTLGKMSRAKSIIFLIDPTSAGTFSRTGGTDFNKVMIENWLVNLFVLQGEETLKQHIAFCLSKMDLPGHCDHFDDPKNYCLEIVGKQVEQAISLYCNLENVNFFSTSSIGFIPGTRDSNQTITSNGPKLLYPAEPVNLFQPFLWFFDAYS